MRYGWIDAITLAMAASALLIAVLGITNAADEREQMHDDIYQQVLDKVRFDLDELGVQVNENNEIIHRKVQMVERLADRAHARAVEAGR